MERLKLVSPAKEHEAAVMDFRAEFLRAKEKNGGMLEKIIPHPGFPDVKRYYIDLRS